MRSRSEIAKESSRRATTPDLVIEEVTPNGGAVFDEFYALYARLFPLVDEREPPQAFLTILALNDRRDLQRRLGPWREIVVAVRRGVGGPVVGGHVFGLTTSPAHVEFGCLASVQAIYTFFDRPVRGQTSVSQVRRFMEQRALQAFDLPESRIKPLIFFEVNNPLRMSAEAIAVDTRNSGVDPHHRYVFWQRVGFRPLAFPYVQPRLRPEAAPVHFLDLFCSTDAGPVPARMVANHLRAFVSMSVLKGQPASTDPDFRTMHQWLSSRDTVPFIPISDEDQMVIRQRARRRRTTDEEG